jgi:hypothetical protein
MTEVVLDGHDGRRLSLRTARRSDPEGIWSYEAILSVPEGELRTEVWDHGVGVAALMRDLADAWRGFEGVKEYTSLEGGLALECRHDGLGSVYCTATLRRPAPPEWSFAAVVTWGAGAHLERLADEVRSWISTSQ